MINATGPAAAALLPRLPPGTDRPDPAQRCGGRRRPGRRRPMDMRSSPRAACRKPRPRGLPQLSSAGTPALPCPSDPARGVSLASASAEHYIDKAIVVLADASKAMGITVDVGRDLHVNTASWLGVDTAAFVVMANALPCYSVKDRMRLIEVVDARRVEARGALPCSPGRSATTPQAFPRSPPSH